MSSAVLPYPLTVTRRVALHAQGLNQPTTPDQKPTMDDLYRAIERIGCLQIDSLQMVRRSHYLALWSRVGQYDPADLDRLTFDPLQRRLFEHWLHEACFIPLTEYRYQLPVMRRFRESGHPWTRDYLEKPENQAMMAHVLAKIRTDGPVRGADFERTEPRSGTWGNWNPAKRALEQLFIGGELMIAHRVNFQRVYDLRERVLPAGTDSTEPTVGEMRRHLLENSAKALGVSPLMALADYTHMKRGEAKPVLIELLNDGVLRPIQIETYSGGSAEWVIHREQFDWLEQAAADQIRVSRTTFLSPFDSLFWAKGRDTQLWGFTQLLEAYKPAPIRQWGYFCLPILYQDRLIGRFDPKLERASGTLRLKALHIEPGITVDDAMIAALAAALRDFLAFHDATTLIIERSDPPAVADWLLRAM